jgi:hypothetical protein
MTLTKRAARRRPVIRDANVPAATAALAWEAGSRGSSAIGSCTVGIVRWGS